MIILLLAVAMTAVSAINLNKNGHDTMGADGSQSQTKNALYDGPCEEALNLTAAQLEKEMEYFSRKFDVKNFHNALKIMKNMSKGGQPNVKAFVHTWELYDKAFSFPRVRRYEFVQENMDMLEHFQDNLNTNIDNSQHLVNFIRVAKAVKQNFVEKYGPEGGFDDPADTDPYEEVDNSVIDWSKVSV